jgi:glycosyltransferase involved in cell wall biosynthesis
MRSREHIAALTPPGRRILVLSAHRGHLDRRIVAEANTLVAAGHAVTLASVPVELAGTGLDARVTVRMPSPAREGCGTGLRGLVNHLPAVARKVLRAAWVRSGGLERQNHVADWMALVPAGTECDVLHCHDLPMLPVGVALRARWPRARLVYDTHEFYPYQYPVGSREQRHWSGVEARTIRQADRILAVNDSVADALREEYGIARPDVLFNSCERPASFLPLRRDTFLAHFGAPSIPSFVFLFHGSFNGARNLERLTRAAARVRTEAILCFLGWGDHLVRLRKLVRRESIRNVFFGQAVPQDRLLNYVAAADMGVIPYIADGLKNNLFCTPNKLFEYIEAQVPICGSRLPELTRIIEGHSIGRTYPMESVEQIALALQDGMAACRAGAFGPEARARAREVLAWERQAQVLLSVYESLGV